MYTSSNVNDSISSFCCDTGQSPNLCFYFIISTSNTRQVYTYIYIILYLTKYKYNAKKTWGILNTLIGRNNTLGGISESFKINGNITNDKKIISNKFGEFFSEIGNKYASNIPPARKPFYRHLQNNHNARSMFMSPRDEVEVCNIITSMKAKGKK